MGEYIDKKVGRDINDTGSLQNSVNKRFKELDKKSKEIDNKDIRDDQEILKAGWNVCEQIKKELTTQNTTLNGQRIMYGKWALEPISNLIIDLKKRHNNLSNKNIIKDKKILIDQVANRIDNAENEVLIRLAKNRTTQNSRNIVNKGNEAHKDRPMFVMEGGNDYRKQTGNIIFTEAANPVKIHEALKGLFSNPDIVYEIDYSGCDTSTPKGKAIKEKMTKLIGVQTCYLRYDKDQKTYTIRDKDGNGISDRAYIWEGVKLIPAGVRARQAYREQRSQNENLGKLNSNQLNFLTKNMLKDMPSAKNLTPQEQNELVVKTENRITELLKRAKELGYELETECVSRKLFGNGHMELHLNSGSSETDRTVWGNDGIGTYNKTLGKKLYNFIGSNGGEYKRYLTNRVKAKRQELESLTKTETIDVGKKGQKVSTQEEKELAKSHKQQVLYGIGLFEKMVDNYKENEGDSRLDNDDKDLVQIKKLIRNAKASINNSNNLDDNAIINNFINPIWEKRASIKKISKKINNGQGQIFDNPAYKEQYNQLKIVFLGDKNKQISAIRTLGGHGRLFDNTETSFLAEEIEGNEDLGVKDQEVQKCINNIKNRTTMSIYNKDGSINQKVKGRYDNTYASAKKGTDSLITLFVGRGWLPKNWKKEEKEVRKCMDNLRDKLNSIDSQVNNLNLSVDSMIKEQHQKRLKLEQKENKTEDEIITLQGLIYLEDPLHSEEQKTIYKEIIEKTNIELKYGNLGQVVKGGLMSALGELGGGVTGKNADIYNDIKGYGRFNLSDENAKIAGEIITEIAITVAVAVVTGGVGGVAMATALRGAAFAARGAKWVNLANKIYKVVNISQKGYKGLSIGAKALKLGYRGTSLLLEGTAFNNTSKAIHAALKGTSLDSLNLNPLTRENVETAAFLFMLGIGNQIAGKGFKLFDKPGKYARTKIHLNSSNALKSIGKKMNEVGAEMAGMLIATEGINLTFGHEVVDQTTGEVKNVRGLSWPSNEEWATMIGMIIAFKAVKPNLWGKLTEKLNDGTLMICRTENRKNPVIRNTKTGALVPLKDLANKTDIITSERRTGTEEGERRTGAEEGERRTGAEEGERRTGAEDGERRTGAEEGERRTGAEDGRMGPKAETVEKRDINKIKEALAEKESRLKGEEAEAEVLSRLVNRMKNKGELSEREKRRLQTCEENLSKRNEDIAKLKEEIQKDKKDIEEYEKTHRQETAKEGERNYFDGKKSRFNITEEVARNNSQTMDKIVDRNNPNDLAFMRETISIQYKAATGKDCPELTDQQLRTIIEAHKQLGELGNLTQGELIKKVRILSKTVTDANFRRFLLESGFCGRGGRNGIEKAFKKSLVDRDQFADTISKNRWEKRGIPEGKIEIRKGEYLSVDRFFKRHPNMKAKYQEALKIQDEGIRSRKLSEIDVEVAEQRILESGRAIEFGAGKAKKAEVSYNALNQLYNGKVEKIVRDDGTIVFRLKQETSISGGEIIPAEEHPVVTKPKAEVVKPEPSLLEVIGGENLPAVIGERLPATITLKGGEIVPAEKVMPPAVQKKVNRALAVIEKRGGLPAVIAKNPEIIPVLPSKGIVSPYWLVPLLLIPGLHWDESEKHAIIIQLPDDFSDVIDNLDKNPKSTGVELPTDITGPFDSRGDSNGIKSEIDSKFSDLLRENNIEQPLKDNALIVLRGVSSWTYRGNGSGEQYNKDLSMQRAEEFKRYLMQKFPELTDDNFVLDSYYQPNNIDEAQRFQGVSMGVVDMQKYGGIGNIRRFIPSGQDGRVL